MILPAKVTGGVKVTEETALTYSAVWACVRVISETLAMLPLGVYRRRPNGGRDPMPDHPVDWLLDTQANPETTAFQFRECMYAWMTTWGNGYAEIERDAADRPVWLWQLSPDRVNPDRTKNGRLVYDVYNPGEPNTVLDAADVFHLKGLGFDGLVGYSVIGFAARAIGTALGAEMRASTFFANDSTPGGMLKHPGKLSETAEKRLRETWQARHGGPYNRRTVAILEEGMDWADTGLPPKDEELLQSRQFSPLEICRFFRMQPHKIADLSRATFSNIEESNRDHVSDTLMPPGVRFEKEANIKLFGRTNRGSLYVRHNFNALLRGNVAARTAFYTAMLDRGVFDIDEVRELEEMNPLGPDGKKRFVPMNMQLLEKAGEEPPDPEPAPGEPPPDETGDEPAPTEPDAEPTPGELARSRILAAQTLLAAEAIGRTFRRAEQRALAAEKRFASEPSRYEPWLEDFAHVDSRNYLDAAITPVVTATCELAGIDGGPARVVKHKFLDEFSRSLAGTLRKPTDAACDADGIAREFIATVLGPDVSPVPEASPAAPPVVIHNHVTLPETKVESHYHPPAPLKKTAKRQPDGTWDIRAVPDGSGEK